MWWRWTRRAADAGRFQPLAHDPFVVGVGHVDVDGLVAGDGADHADDVLDRAVVEPRKGDALGTRPADPGAGVTPPLRRERVAVLGRRAGEERGAARRRRRAASPRRSASGRRIDEAPGQVAVGVDAAIAQERPMRAGELDAVEIARHDQHLLACRCWRASPPSRRARRRTTAPRTPGRRRCTGRPSAPATRSWPTRLGTHTQQPLATAWLRWMSSHESCWADAVLRLLARMPADRRRVEQDLGALQRGQPRRLRDTTDPSR